MVSINSDKPLFTPAKLGSYEFPNRIAMSAMTRTRADPSTGIPTEIHVQYYSERAEGAAFVLTESVGISKEACTFSGGCGIWSEEQVEGWTKVCEAVHKVGGRIFLQIWHCGRSGRSKTTGSKPVGPSPIPMRTPDSNSETGYKCAEMPEELTEQGILEILEQFRKGAENALRAGFDGIQLHGANGYLIDNFLRDCSNQRTDKYGGSIENRCRFPLMVIDVLASVFGPERTGIKISPTSRYQDMYDSDPFALSSYLLTELSKMKIGFVEIANGDAGPTPNLYGVNSEDQMPSIFKQLRPYFSGTLIGNTNITFELGNKLVDEGVIDLATFGRPYIANPDLVERFRNGWELNEVDYSKCYVGGVSGYIDYPKYNKNK